MRRNTAPLLQLGTDSAGPHDKRIIEILAKSLELSIAMGKNDVATAIVKHLGEFTSVHDVRIEHCHIGDKIEQIEVKKV